ncbi:hypothetical protein [Aeoliella mucimassa]|uniref:hypothetical protein n=1 Tax=Aeoliella mucimassa TaxID=2527972 RepID=UPI0011A3627F|nr:hypothetical protein [Aeoliella mucimassa]
MWKTSIPSAIKAFYREENFFNELRCYQRLQSHGVNEICGLNVPVLEDFDDQLWVIEITFVQAPYLLDFGKATLDAPPPYLVDPQDQRRFQAEWRTEFGSRWTEVNAILHILQSKYGIYYLDPKVANIRLSAEEDDDEDWLKEPEIDYTEYD